MVRWSREAADAAVAALLQIYRMLYLVFHEVSGFMARSFGTEQSGSGALLVLVSDTIPANEEARFAHAVLLLGERGHDLLDLKCWSDDETASELPTGDPHEFPDTVMLWGQFCI